MLQLQEDLPGRFPRRLWCKHKNSVKRKFYWTCFDCKAIRWNVGAILQHNREEEKLLGCGVTGNISDSESDDSRSES